jgi:hypothetical protein
MPCRRFCYSSQSVQRALFCLLKELLQGLDLGHLMTWRRQVWAPGVSSPSRSGQIQGEYAMVRRSIHLVRVSRAFRGEMAIIYRYVAFVYHHVHLGPRYASASCQVFLPLSLSTSMALWTGLDSSTGLELGSGPGPGMPSFSNCVVFTRGYYRTPTSSRTKSPCTLPQSLPETYCARRVEILFALP